MSNAVEPEPDVAAMPAPPVSQDTAALYLDLLKRAVTGFLYLDADDQAHRFNLENGTRLTPEQARNAGERRRLRINGMDWPGIGHAMSGFARLENFECCIRQIVADKVPGDILEAGVWRGGTSIFARGVLKALGDTQRTVWLADSFAGLPPPDPARYPADKGCRLHEAGYLKVDLDSVKRAFEYFGLLDERVRFIEGFFEETLPQAPVEKLAIARLDGDMYSSTIVSLESLYPKISTGGFVIIDDYSIPSCKKAVDDFRSAKGIAAPLQRIDWTGVYWQVDQSR